MQSTLNAYQYNCFLGTMATVNISQLKIFFLLVSENSRRSPWYTKKKGLAAISAITPTATPSTIENLEE
jgi:hypothetical protein